MGRSLWVKRVWYTREYVVIYGYYDEMLTFWRTMMSSALKTNPYLERGMITGCLRVSKESSLSGLNNVESHTIMSEGKREFFGFEPAEVQEMLRYFNLDDAYPQFEYNYDGYNFCGRHAHNPWSVIMCTRALLEGCELPYRTYWLNTSGNAVVERVIQQNESIRQKCFELLQGKTIRARVSEFLTWKDLRYDSKNAWSLLTFSGYLTSLTPGWDIAPRWGAYGSALRARYFMTSFPVGAEGISPAATRHRSNGRGLGFADAHPIWFHDLWAESCWLHAAGLIRGWQLPAMDKAGGFEMCILDESCTYIQNL